MIFWVFLIFSFSIPKYSVSQTTCTITGDGTVDIDSYHQSGSYAKYTVINIGTEITTLDDDCFSYSDELTTVNFEEPSKLTSIGQYVFNSCGKLKSIKLPDSVQTIGPYFLRGCSSITSFYIGPNIELIGIPIIYNVKTFTEFNVHKDNKYYSNDEFGVLYNKDKTILYVVPSGCNESYQIPTSVKELNSHCFHGLLTIKELFLPKNVEILNPSICEFNNFSTTMIFDNGINISKICDNVFANWYSLKSIIIPECITALPERAFYNCLCLESIDIPKSVESIPSSAFEGCNSLKNVNISEENDNFTSINGVIFSKNKEEMLIIPTSVEYVEIPKECNTIPTTGLQFATSLTWVTIEDGNKDYTTDGHIIYKGTNIVCCIGGVSNITVNETTTQININAFAYTTKIQSIDLTKTQISTIQSSAFSSSNLTTIAFPSTLTLIGSSAFRYCQSLISVNFSSAGTKNLNISIYCFEECTKIKSIIFPPNIEYIFRSAFINCGIETITFQEKSNLIFIDKDCFSKCKIQSLKLPDSLEIIDENAFKSNPIKQITFGTGIQTISTAAFDNCSELIKIEFPNDCQLKEINSAAFMSCSSIQEFVIPESVESFHFSVFQECTNLINISVANDNEDSHFHSISGILYSDDYSTLIICPNGKKEASVDSRVIRLGVNSFYGCIKLETLLFEKNSKLQTIGSNTFYNCISLSTVEFPNSLKNISENAFFGCTNLTTLNFGEESQLTTLGSETFKGCTLLKNVNLPKISPLNEISKSIFEDCSSLETIYIPNSIQYLSEGCFRNCISLTKVIINSTESSLISIGVEAFKGCSKLQSFRIPNSLSAIETNSFSSCSKLKTIIYCGFDKFEAGNVFNDCNPSLTINVRYNYSYNKFCGMNVIKSLNDHCNFIKPKTDLKRISFLSSVFTKCTMIMILTSTKQSNK